MTFSIVIPTYNGAKFVEQALQSALAQTRPADEIIVSDDNSTDDTLEICRKYSDRIKIFVNEDGPSGFVNGWNKAIAHATSDFISILHQDDLLDPTFLEEIEKAAALNPDVKHFFVPCKYIDAAGEVTSTPECADGTIKRYKGPEYVEAYTFEGSPHIHRCPGVVTAKSIFDVCKYRTEAGHIADDDFFWRVGQYTDVIGVLKPLSSYRHHSQSETGHLTQIALVHRLLDDHIFQCLHIKDNPVMPEKVKAHLRRWKKKFAIRLMIYSLKNRDAVNLFYGMKRLVR